MRKLTEMLNEIPPLNESAMNTARKRQAQRAKPPGSLGRLEELSIQMVGITGRVHNHIQKTHLLVFVLRRKSESGYDRVYA